MVRFPHNIRTEIRFISFSSEEAGLRGSRRYVERYLDELKRLDTQLLNFEMVAHPEIHILTSDVNGTLQNSSEMVKSVVAAVVSAGVPHKVQSASLGVGTMQLSSAGLVSRPQRWFSLRCHNRLWPSIIRSGTHRKC